MHGILHDIRNIHKPVTLPLLGCRSKRSRTDATFTADGTHFCGFFKAPMHTRNLSRRNTAHHLLLFPKNPIINTTMRRHTKRSRLIVKFLTGIHAFGTTLREFARAGSVSRDTTSKLYTSLWTCLASYEWKSLCSHAHHSF